MKMLFIVPLVLFSMIVSAQVDPTMAIPAPAGTYEQMMRQAGGWKIAGGVSAGAGIIFWVVAAAKVTREVVGVIVLNPPDENAGKAEATIGTVLFASGAAMFMVGAIRSSKAKKMLAAGQISLTPVAPPAFIAPGTTVRQAGVTYKMAFPFGK
ncbi:MAG TPA: hypothetical protein VK907_11635 [Phnomibacter sp.]|nr:hypothetical protein [Phnomibacter sp.]